MISSTGERALSWSVLSARKNRDEDREKHAQSKRGPVAYGVNQVKRFTAYVDRILKGEKPGDLPVQAPIKFASSSI